MNRKTTERLRVPQTWLVYFIGLCSKFKAVNIGTCIGWLLLYAVNILQQIFIESKNKTEIL